MKRLLLATALVLLSGVWLCAQPVYDSSNSSDSTGVNPKSLALTNANQSNPATFFFMAAGDAAAGGTLDTLSAVPTYNSVNSTADGYSPFTSTATFKMRDEGHFLVNPTHDASSHNCTWNWGSSALFTTVGCITLYNVNQTTPIRNTTCRQTQNDAGGTTSLSVACTTVANDLLLCVIQQHSGSGSYANISAETGTQRTISTGGRIRMAIYTQAVSGTSTTFSATFASGTDFTVICLPIEPPAVTATGAASGFSLLGVGVH